MIIQLKQDAAQGQVDNLLAWLGSHGIEPHVSVGAHTTLIGCVGDVSRLDIDLVQALDVVESVQRIQEPYKAANRKFHPNDSVSGNPNVMLCERGIRTFETATRNTIDLTVVPILHRLSHLPVLVDPSHSTGVARLVHPLAVAATAIGADGLIIEVHNDPPHAKCDGAQSQTPAMFAETMEVVRQVRPYACK